MSESLRDTISDAFDQHAPAEGVTPAVETPAGTDTGQVEQTAIPAEPAKSGRTEGRARDEKGRLLPGPAKREAATTPPETVATPAAAPAAPALPPLTRPSSWKKEMWPVWEKLSAGTPLSAQEARQLAEYNISRENDFAKGVSTYKNEWDNVRPIAEAMAQFAPILQQHGIKPEQWITNLGNAHKTLAMGTPQQKLSAFVKLASDYQIPLHEMVVQGQDGKLYINPNIPAMQPQQQQAAQQPQDIEKLLDQKLMEREVSREIQAFVTATDDKGQLKYPHFEAVRETMIGLLQANLAANPQEAYDLALKHPRHSEIYAGIQAQEQKLAAERKAQEQAATVARARSQAVSTRTAAPSAPVADRPKGVRGAIEAAFDEHAPGGRI